MICFMFFEPDKIVPARRTRWTSGCVWWTTRNTATTRPTRSSQACVY